MKTPAFFDAVPPIVVFDPLAEALGAAEGGVVEYRYADAVVSLIESGFLDPLFPPRISNPSTEDR